MQVWDQDLADMARLDTDCSFTRGPMTQPDSRVEDGKLIEIATGVTNEDTFLHDAFFSWQVQGGDYDFNSYTCTSQEHNCEHLIQVNQTDLNELYPTSSILKVVSM